MTEFTDPVAATLDQWRADHEAANAFGANASDPVPPLLAAIEAVLDLHQPITRRRGWRPTCSFDNHSWPCPEVAAIAAALTGKDSSDA